MHGQISNLTQTFLLESGKIYLHLKQTKWQNLQSVGALTANLNKVEVTIVERLPDITENDCVSITLT